MVEYISNAQELKNYVAEHPDHIICLMDRKPDFYKLLLDIDLSDANHLHAVMSALEAESDVASVVRRRDPALSMQAAAAE